MSTRPIRGLSRRQAPAAALAAPCLLQPDAALAWPFNGEVRYPPDGLIRVSDAGPEAWSDLPAYDFVVADSQVSYGEPSVAPVGVGALFGVFGALAGAAVANVASKKSGGVYESRLKLRFHDDVAALMAARLSGAHRMAGPGEAATLEVLPSIRFEAETPQTPRLQTRLDVRFRGLPRGRQEVKVYRHIVAAVRPMDAWVADDAQSLRAAVRASFEVLIDVIVDDLRGRFDEAFSPEVAPVTHWLEPGSSDVSYGVMLRDTPARVLLAMQRNQSADPTRLRLIDRAFFQPAPAPKVG